jgi:hypothetical protein
MSNAQIDICDSSYDGTDGFQGAASKSATDCSPLLRLKDLHYFPVGSFHVSTGTNDKSGIFVPAKDERWDPAESPAGLTTPKSQNQRICWILRARR